MQKDDADGLSAAGGREKHQSRPVKCCKAAVDPVLDDIDGPEDGSPTRRQSKHVAIS
jgi:hypothetical protein